MTYEKFANEMTAKSPSITRKEIRAFAIKYALLLLFGGFSISLIITSILGMLFSVLFMLLILFLYVSSFDIIAENVENFNKVRKIIRFWWLYVILIFISCVLINIFIL